MRKWLALRLYWHRHWPAKRLWVTAGHDQHGLAYTVGIGCFGYALFVSAHCVYLRDGKVDMKRGYTSSFHDTLASRGWL